MLYSSRSRVRGHLSLYLAYCGNEEEEEIDDTDTASGITSNEVQ